MSIEDRVAAMNERYTDWLMSLDEGPYDDEEEEELDDEELTYYVKRKR